MAAARHNNNYLASILPNASPEEKRIAEAAMRKMILIKIMKFVLYATVRIKKICTVN